MNILITGAGGNLGRALVERLLPDGHAIAATVSPGKALGYPVNGAIHVLPADLSNESAAGEMVARAIAKLGRLDAAVLTVGGFTPGNLEATHSEVLHIMFAMNFETAFFVARPVFLHLAEKGGGKMILVGARTARLASQGKNAVAYSLSKSLIFALSDLLNAEGSDKGVTSTVIVPSTIDTTDNRKAMPQADFSKWTKPEAIADVIASLIKGQLPHQAIIEV